jgi:hypothetical protein
MQIQCNKMVVLVPVVIVRLEEQLYLGREMMVARLLDTQQILLLAVEVLVLLAELQLEQYLEMVDLVRQVQLVDLQLLMQAEEEEVAFQALPLEQADLVEEATDRIVLMVVRELQIQEVEVEEQGI